MPTPAYPARTLTRKYACLECGKMFPSIKRPSSAPNYCPECLPVIRARQLEKLRLHNTKLQAQATPCEVCGSLNTVRHNRAFKTCGSPECRLEMRRRVGREQAARKRETKPVNTCLRCGREFEAEHRFNRRCISCSDTIRENYNFVECWG